MTTSLVLHGHFYQPPRENPWTGAVEREPSAHPDHDWNARILRECYRANAFARVFDHFGRVERIVNNYEYASFNFGPTLLSWIEVHDPDTYARILAADRNSARRLGGHGNAIAQGYNHTILPLCNERDRRTQIRWGIADFTARFGRAPESLWLPETACNHPTLDALIDEGLRYVILSPYQAERVRPIGAKEWKDVSGGSVDPGQPYRALHSNGGGSIAVFFYDGPISRSLAFEGALGSSQALVARLAQAGGNDGRLVHIATDGESYGHHTRFGDRALAHAVTHESKERGFVLTNYSAYLAENPPRMEVEIKSGPGGEGTAWSCAHGVGRWYRDCGCSTGAQEGWNQAWRGPLRKALDVLRDRVARHFEETRGELFRDPWATRDRYLSLLLRPGGSKEPWLAEEAGHPLDSSRRHRALSHLELQRNAQLMYTSCGWFFADISGIETVQVMKYAQRAFDLLDELGLEGPREAFFDALSEARSNLPEMGNGVDVFRRFVDPLRVQPARVAAHIAVTSLVGDSPATGSAAGFRFNATQVRKERHGRLILGTARIELEEQAREKQHDLSVAAMHFGGVDFYCVARPFAGLERFHASVARLWSSFRTASLPTMLRVAQEEFGPEEYGLESLLPEGRQRITSLVLGDIVANFTDQYARLYESNQRVLEMLQNAGLEFPSELLAAAEFTFSRRFEAELLRAAESRDPESYVPALEIAEEARRRGFAIDTSNTGPVFSRVLAGAAKDAVSERTPESLRAASELARLARSFGMDQSLERAQEIIDESIPIGSDASIFFELRRAFDLVTRADAHAGSTK